MFSFVVVCKRAISTLMVLLSPGLMLSPKMTNGVVLFFVISSSKDKNNDNYELLTTIMIKLS